MLSLFAISVFCVANMPTIPEKYRSAYLWFTFLFFAPYSFGIHFASEGWSGACILIAVSLYLFYEHHYFQRGLLSFFLIGMMVGLAFLCRFQTFFFSAGLVFWLIIIKREKLNNLVPLIAGGLVILMLGILIDRWFYGVWVFTPWKYFESNLVNGVAAKFGIYPFYSYCLWLSLYLSPPVGVLSLIAMLLLFSGKRRNMYTWIVGLFFVMHSLIGHKELRFMYPLMLFLPIIIFQLVDIKNWLRIVLNRFTLVILISFNLVLLLLLVVFPMSLSNDPKTFGYEIHQLAATKAPVYIYYSQIDYHPYSLNVSANNREVAMHYLIDENVHFVNAPINQDSPDTTYGLELISTSVKELSACGLENKFKKYQLLSSTLPKRLVQISFSSTFPIFLRNAIQENCYLLYQKKSS
jgi:phosphatidylinositol glycan class B